MSIQQLCQCARDSTQQLSYTTHEAKKSALLAMADQLMADTDKILAANQQDIAAGKQNGLSTAMLDRLLLNLDRIAAMANGIRDIAQLDDPTQRVLAQWTRPNGLTIQRVSVPIGVIGVIYESRPNVTADAAALCIQSGNAVILRGGSESFHSNQAIAQSIKTALASSTLPSDCVQILSNPDRALIDQLIVQTDLVDVIIPRGGPRLINYLMEHSKIPLFKHLQGLCHTYVHQSADVDMAANICVNAKMRRTGICGATETILIDRAAQSTHLPVIIKALQAQHCEILGDQSVCALFDDIIPATESDWHTEYLDAIISIRLVDDINQAIDHIRQYSSNHTDAIIAEDSQAVTQFFNQVDSAIVMHNASTQFADGGEFGMGAEIGIATGKLHARGPVGVEQLTTFKYIVKGNGQTRP